jgi:4'-phosphopantetheinyl transferase
MGGDASPPRSGTVTSVLGVGAGEVRVWRVEVAGAARRAVEHALTENERDRAARFRADDARERFVVARGAARTILGDLLGRDPAALRFEHRCAVCGSTEHGKPHVAGAPELDFNVSHSGDLVLVAVARGRAVGVDVERERDTARLDRLARRSLSEAERELVAAAHGDERRAAFFRAWTAKEAYLKGRGLGVTGALNRWSIAPDGTVTAGGDQDPEAARWRVRRLDVGPGYAAAVAAEGDFEPALASFPTA